eukprot:jgi/Botrbrau1/8928/Bobra.0148s0041.1
MSKSGNLAAYTVANVPEEGEPAFSAFVKDLSSGCITEVDKNGNTGSLEWVGDRSLVYTVIDGRGIPSKAMRRKLPCGRCAGEVALLAEEVREGCFLTVTASKDRHLIFVNSNSKTSSEVTFIRQDDPTATPRLISSRQNGLEYFAEHWKGNLLLLTNMGEPGSNLCLAVAPLSRPFFGNWTVLVPPRPDVAIDDLCVFSSACLLLERHALRPAISILPLPLGDPDPSLNSRATNQSPVLDPSAFKSLFFPPDITHVSLGTNLDYWAPGLRVYASSPIQRDIPLDISTDPDAWRKTNCALGIHDRHHSEDYSTVANWNSSESTGACGNGSCGASCSCELVQRGFEMGVGWEGRTRDGRSTRDLGGRPGFKLHEIPDCTTCGREADTRGWSHEGTLQGSSPGLVQKPAMGSQIFGPGSCAEPLAVSHGPPHGQHARNLTNSDEHPHPSAYASAIAASARDSVEGTIAKLSHASDNIDPRSRPDFQESREGNWTSTHANFGDSTNEQLTEGVSSSSPHRDLGESWMGTVNSKRGGTGSQYRGCKLRKRKRDGFEQRWRGVGWDDVWGPHGGIT